MIMTRGTLNSIQVVFTNSNSGVFFAGQQIQGHVALNIVQSGLRAKKIEMRLKGDCIVKWQDTKEVWYTDSRGNRRTRSETVTKQDYEEYFRAVIPIWRAANETGMLLPGFQTIDFTYTLPAYIPPSFEGKFGQIRYSAKAEIMTPNGNNLKAERQFTVNNILDLNADPDAQKSFIDEKTKHLCCLCCRSGPICAVVKLSRRGFVAGEALVIDAEIDNQSNRKVRRSTATLMQEIVYRAQGEVKHDRRILVEKMKGEIRKGCSDSWENDPLVIPAVPPSELSFCSLIDVSYYLEFSVDPAGPSFNLKFRAPIIVGNIPFRQSFSNFIPACSHAPTVESFEASAPPLSESMNPLLANHPDLPPPTYDQAVYGSSCATTTKFEMEEENEKAFRPLYVCYQMHTPSAPPL